MTQQGNAEPTPVAVPASHAEQGLQPLRALLTSDDVNEVVINPDGGIWVERSGNEHMIRWEGNLPENRIKPLGGHLAGETGNQLGPKHPIVSGRVMLFGQTMRVQIIVPPAIERGVSVSIRKYVKRIFDAKDFGFLEGHQVDVEGGRIKRLQELQDMANAGALYDLYCAAISEKFNILVSGGTSSGKTSLAQALLALSDQGERIVTIEDAPELNLPHPNTVTLVAEKRDGSQRSPARLLESSLRMRPDRLILGEIRGVEAVNFLEAINTGHPGSISTIHANSPILALESLVSKVCRAGTNQTRQDVLDYTRQTIDLIIQMERRGGKRGVLQVYMPALAK